MTNSPESVVYVLMDLTVNVANGLKISPFEVMAQDVDNTILLINYFIEKNDKPTADAAAEPHPKAKQKDSFWDF